MSDLHRAVIAVGSNIDAETNFAGAADLLATSGRIAQFARIWKTPAVGEADQPDFLNSAVLLETDLMPGTLKNRLLEIEAALKRVRIAGRACAPRTIDLDLVLFNDWIGGVDGLKVPDPDIVRYAHCALPVADLLGHAVHPQTGETFREIAARFEPETRGWEIVTVPGWVVS